MATGTLVAAAVALAGVLAGGCAGPAARWTRPDYDAAGFARDSQACTAEMYAVRSMTPRAAPNWHVHDYCMTRRGYMWKTPG